MIQCMTGRMIQHMIGRGRFITLEGIEGTGKSTHLAMIHDILVATGIQVMVTREPGGTALGEALRQIVLDPDYKGMSADAELLIMFAARAEHLASLIRPQLALGNWVLCDRFTDATYAYQGGGRGVPLERIAALEDWAQGSLRPDLTLILDAPPAQALARTRKRGRAADRFEQEDLIFFQRVREAYLMRAREYPERYRVVDASRELNEVQSELRYLIHDLAAAI